MRSVMTLMLLGLFTSTTLAAAPKVAVVYSSWPEGKNSFINEFDGALSSLGWGFEKFENVKIAELGKRLDEFDMVIGTAVANFEHPQNMTPYKDRWLAFLERGGCLLITDASYASVLNLWVNTFGDEFKLTTEKCAAYLEKGPEARAITVADHALVTVPNDLAPLLRTRTSIWAHLESWPEGWESLVACKDKKSLFLVRPVGKGLLVVTSYYSFKGTRGSEVAAAMLENIWLYVAHRRAGIEVTGLHFGKMAPGAGVAQVGLKNVTDGPLALRSRVRIEPEGQEAVEGEVVESALEAGGAADSELPFEITIRGRMIVRVRVEDQDGKLLMDWPRQVEIPPAVRIALKRKHVYPRQPHLEASVLLLPDAGIDPDTLRLEYQIDGGAGRTARVEGDSVALKASVGDLPKGEHQLRLRLLVGDREIGQASAQFFTHQDPRVAIREDGVTLLEGKPFFPFGFYHVSWPFDLDHRIQMARDLAEAGFNVTHAGIKRGELEVYGKFLDECAKLGVFVVTEFGESREETVKRYRDHPAVLAWNPGDEPAARGVSADTMYSRFDTFKQLDPSHLVYTVICRPGEYRNYARGTDVLAPDVYPVPRRPISDVYERLRSAQIEAARFDTTLWGVLQCFGNYGGWQRPPSPQELRAMTYLALLAGVKGIIYYTYVDGKWSVTENPEQWEAAKALVPEIERLAPTVMDGKFTLLSEGEGDIYAGLWEHEGTGYVVIVNAANEAREFELAVRGKSAKALFGEGATPRFEEGKLTGQIEGLATMVLTVTRGL